MDKLEAQVGRMRSQLAALRRDDEAAPDDATQALRTTLEELYVAEEELRLQHEEILGARAEAEEQRRRYEELFQLAPDAYLATDPVGVVREANRAASGLLRLEPRFLVGKPLANLVHPADRGDLRRLINDFEAATRVDEWAIRVVPRQGDPVSVSVTASAARDVRDRLVGIRWLLRDVSARERGERELRALADRRRATLDFAPDGICRLDRDGAVEYANPAAARLLGRGIEELRGRQLVDVLVEGQTPGHAYGDSRVRLERTLAGLRPGAGSGNTPSLRRHAS